MLKYLKFIIATVFYPYLEFPWSKVFSILWQSIQLYCVNFILVLCFILSMPIFVEWNDIFQGIKHILYVWFIVGVKIHLIFFIVCLLITLTNEKL